MPRTLNNKLVIGLDGSALFDTRSAHKIFEAKGLPGYQAYIKRTRNQPFKPGPAFPLVSKLLRLNEALEDNPVEIVLFSKDSAATGARLESSLHAHGLSNIIEIKEYGNGHLSPAFIPKIGGDNFLFLTALACEAKDSVAEGITTGLVSAQQAPKLAKGEVSIPKAETPLSVVYDFDGVIADHTSENFFQRAIAENSYEIGLEKYRQHEAQHINKPLAPGPLAPFFLKLSALAQQCANLPPSSTNPLLSPRIVTARGELSKTRADNTLVAMGAGDTSTTGMPGYSKAQRLHTFNPVPDAFIDDQAKHLLGIPTQTLGIHLLSPGMAVPQLG